MRGLNKGLPAQQKKLMVAVLAHVEEHGVVPTHTELARALGLKSNASIYDFLRSMAYRGIIIRRPEDFGRRRSRAPSKDQHSPNTVRERPALIGAA